jgi:hypothetical protein
MLQKISTQNLKNQNPQAFSQMKEEFMRQAKDKPKEFIFFAAQFLQFYTVICNQELAKITEVSQFYHFLELHSQQFGDFSNNYFIEECLLIKIYNKISELDEKFESEAKDDETRFKRILIYDLQKLKYLLSQISLSMDKDIKDSPKRLFLNYLDIILNYTQALKIEFEMKLNLDNPANEYLVSMNEQQQNYFKNIQDCIHEIESGTYQMDLFLMGDDLFSRFPIKSFVNFKSHISSLRKE